MSGQADDPAAAPPPLPDGADRVVETLIPYRNVAALIAYYVGVFSVIPCLGALTGLPAVALGIIGLVYAHRHEEARGRVHAWIGIALGGLFFLLYTVGFVVLLMTA
ncbi:MAG: hypothetical protein JXR94_20200 [Candidatus Hydrogenedentes bacterium]|nr:hypothetical protein [Candidatus Hydrogenedentota bacterium]